MVITSVLLLQFGIIFEQTQGELLETPGPFTGLPSKTLVLKLSKADLFRFQNDDPFLKTFYLRNLSGCEYASASALSVNGRDYRLQFQSAPWNDPFFLIIPHGSNTILYYENADFLPKTQLVASTLPHSFLIGTNLYTVSSEDVGMITSGKKVPITKNGTEKEHFVIAFRDLAGNESGTIRNLCLSDQLIQICFVKHTNSQVSLGECLAHDSFQNKEFILSRKISPNPLFHLFEITSRQSQNYLAYARIIHNGVGISLIRNPNGFLLSKTIPAEALLEVTFKTTHIIVAPPRQ